MRSTTSLYDGINRGDLESLFELFLKHEGILVRYFRRKHPELTGQTLDYINEALVKLSRRVAVAPQNGAGVMERGKFAAYMKVVIENLIRDLYRIAKRGPRILSLDWPRNGDRSLEPADTREKEPPRRLQQADELERIRIALLAMDPSDREILLLWTMNVDYESIASALGTTRSAVCSRKCRGLARLRDSMNRKR